MLFHMVFVKCIFPFIDQGFILTMQTALCGYVLGVCMCGCVENIFFNCCCKGFLDKFCCMFTLTIKYYLILSLTASRLPYSEMVGALSF